MSGRNGPERRGPERPGPDYPPEWDNEPEEHDVDAETLRVALADLVSAVDELLTRPVRNRGLCVDLTDASVRARAALRGSK